MSEAIDLTTNDAAIIIDQVADQAMGRPLRGYVPTPSAEDAGDVLTAGDDGSYSWEPVNALPDAEEGDAGKVLTLDNELDPVWSTPEKELPTIHEDDVGKALIVGDLGVEWAEFPEELPAVTAADEGKILAVNDSGEWAIADAPSGGDLYWHTVSVVGSNIIFASAIVINSTAANITIADIKSIVNAGGKLLLLNGAYSGSGQLLFIEKNNINPETECTVYYLASDGHVLTFSEYWGTLTVQSFGTDSHKIN